MQLFIYRKPHFYLLDIDQVLKKRKIRTTQTKQINMAVKSTTKKKTSKAKKGKIQDDRLRKIFGIVCYLLAIYLAVAFISYMYTWKTDQDKVLQFSWEIMMQGDLTVSNWLGRLGAFVSNAFFYWGFGLPSIAFVFLLFKLGSDFIKKRSLQLFFYKAKDVLLWIAFLSLVLEFLFRGSDFTWGGAFGESACLWLINFVGSVGLFFLLLFSLVGFVIWQFNPQLSQIQAMLPGGEKISLDTIPFAETINRFLSSMPTIGSEEKVAKSTPSATSFKDDSKGYTALRPSQEDEALDGAVPKTTISTDGQETPGSALDFELPAPSASNRMRKPKYDPSALEMEVTDISEEPKALSSLDFQEESIGDPMDRKTVESGAADKLEINKEEDTSQPYDEKLDLSNYVPPKIEFLEEYADRKVEIDRAELESNKDQIIETLLNYKIEIIKIRATIGPTVTLYEIVPAPGVKISKIKNLEDDIALSLAALGIRIIAPIPGKGTIGIEVPNKNPQIVSFHEVVTTDKFQASKMALPIALGKTISNEVFVADLAKMPHLLVAGATGQGKSVGINTILMSMLYKKHPSQVKLVLIDPKKVELFPYASLNKHFLAFLPDQEEPIVTDTTKAIHTLNSLCLEMDARYDLLKKARARNLKEYNDKFCARRLNPNDGHKFLPYIVLVIDEFADLIMTAGKEIELPIARLAQLARAIGIHLIIATQRPSVNIITGMIKANFPARLAFKVTSKIDSRTILDAGGADQLIGKGDMLLNIGSNIVRLQCAFVDTPEVEKVIDHIADQQGYAEPFYLPEFVGEEDLSKDGSSLKFSDLDSMFKDAAMLIIGSQHGSTSSIQRKLQLGYNRAGRIMDQMEQMGIVGPAKGSKPRDVLFFSVEEFDHWWTEKSKL